MIRPIGLMRLGGMFLKELVLSSLSVAWDVITPRHRSRPGILAVPLDAETDWEITAFSNLVCLTPGTISLEVSPDRKTLYVHAMFIDDPEAVKRHMKETLENRVLETMR